MSSCDWFGVVVTVGTVAFAITILYRTLRGAVRESERWCCTKREDKDEGDPK